MCFQMIVCCWKHRVCLLPQRALPKNQVFFFLWERLKTEGSWTESLQMCFVWLTECCKFELVVNIKKLGRFHIKMWIQAAFENSDLAAIDLCLGFAAAIFCSWGTSSPVCHRPHHSLPCIPDMEQC